MKKTPANCRQRDFHRQPPHAAWNSRPVHHSPYNWKPGFHANHRLDRPPGRNFPLRRPNFMVDLLRFGRRSFRRDDVASLISECKSKPENSSVFHGDRVAASLNFRQWVDALDAVVWFWETRLSEVHDFTPELTSNVLVPSDMDELESRLKTLFSGHVRGLIKEGKEVKRCVEQIARLSKEIESYSKLLSRPLAIAVQNQKMEKKKGLDTEKKMIQMRIEEFRNAMDCVLKYLENEVEDGVVVSVFRFEGRFDWKRVHCLIMRERRRLEQGLPIYAYRSDILQEIHNQQVYSVRNLKI